jgi:hypothetical protein
MSANPSSAKRNAIAAITVALGLLAHALPALADVMPPERRTTWNPGIPGGSPCARRCARP